MIHHFLRIFVNVITKIYKKKKKKESDCCNIEKNIFSHGDDYRFFSGDNSSSNPCIARLSPGAAPPRTRGKMFKRVAINRRRSRWEFWIDKKIDKIIVVTCPLTFEQLLYHCRVPLMIYSNCWKECSARVSTINDAFYRRTSPR